MGDRPVSRYSQDVGAAASGMRFSGYQRQVMVQVTEVKVATDGATAGKSLSETACGSVPQDFRR